MRERGGGGVKYAFMTFSVPEATMEQALGLAKTHGYAGLEPRAEAKHRHGVELTAPRSARQAIRKQAREAGIAIACVATSCTYADPATSAQNTRKTDEYIDLAADVGAPAIRVFGGKIGGGWTRERAIEEVAKALASVADHARERGVVVCMETHDDWCDPRHVAEVMRKVGKPSIGVNWDIMHPVRAAGYQMAASYEPIKSWIRHVHFHDGTQDQGKLVLKPIGQGIVDHATAVRLLAAERYDGFLSGEWIDWEIPAAEHLPREIAAMRSFEPRG
jgi:sugar phosphate isomerase/epimerase